LYGREIYVPLFRNFGLSDILFCVCLDDRSVDYWAITYQLPMLYIKWEKSSSLKQDKFLWKLSGAKLTLCTI